MTNRIASALAPLRVRRGPFVSTVVSDYHTHEKTPGAHMCSTRAVVAELGGVS